MIGSDKRSQRDYRVFREYTDNHGRTFQAQADGMNNQPIGELMPKGFSPPWLPPMRFAKFSQSGDLHFTWDYATMADELSGMTAAYYQDAVKFALEHNKPEPEIGGPVDRSIRYVLGVPPMSPAIPLAAQAGEPWILGMADASPVPELKAILEQSAGADGREAIRLIKGRLSEQIGDRGVPTVAHAEPESATTGKSITDVTYQSFMAESRKRGMGMADIALAWSAHKANLADAQAA